MGTPPRTDSVPGAIDRRISERVRSLLRGDGRTQDSLAAATGIPPTSLSHYVRGTRRWPASAVQAVAEAFGVTICNLYGADEGHGATQGHDQRVAEIRDRAISRLIEGHEEASPAEREFVSTIAEAAVLFRKRLRDEEGLTD